MSARLAIFDRNDTCERLPACRRLPLTDSQQLTRLLSLLIWLLGASLLLWSIVAVLIVRLYRTWRRGFPHGPNGPVL